MTVTSQPTTTGKLELKHLHFDFELLDFDGCSAYGDLIVMAWFSFRSWWRHQMETFSALLAICAGNSPVPGEFPAQRPVTRSFDVFFGLHSNKQLSKQWWGWWVETLSCPFWRHRNVIAWYPTDDALRPHWYEGNYYPPKMCSVVLLENVGVIPRFTLSLYMLINVLDRSYLSLTGNWYVYSLTN